MKYFNFDKYAILISQKCNEFILRIKLFNKSYIKIYESISKSFYFKYLHINQFEHFFSKVKDK